MACLLRNRKVTTRSIAISRAIRYCLFIALLELVSTARLQSQATTTGSSPTTAQTDERAVDKPKAVQNVADPTKPEESEKRVDPTLVTSPEEARRREIIAETEKLYQLAVELRSEVAKTYKETLSLAVVKKAREVEDTAKSLKVRMSHTETASKK